MKRILPAVLVIFMLFGTAWAKELPTRADFSVQLANALELQATNMFPLLRYNDWSSIDGSKRLKISSAIKTGVFAPNGFMLEPNKPIDQADIDTAIFGILRYVATNDQLEHGQGTIMAIVKDEITVQMGEKQFKAKADSPYIGYELSAFSSLKTAQKIEFVANKQGAILLGWDSPINSRIATTVEIGQLYLYDEQNDSLIMTNVASYYDGKWKEISKERYENVKLSPSAFIICDGKKVRKDEINVFFLDRKISVVIGGELGTQKILYAIIQ